MNLPFLAATPTIELRDLLAETLGALAPGETMRFTFEDVAKAAGHSCPTMAGAYLVTLQALRALYPGATPVRGEVEVVVGGDPADGAAGPMAQAIAQITGAAPETGFLGLMGRFRRASLLRFDPGQPGVFWFRRRDNGDTVRLTYDPSSIPADPSMHPLLVGVLKGRVTPDEARRFGELWQSRVAAILTGDPSRVVVVERLGATHGLQPGS